MNKNLQAVNEDKKRFIKANKTKKEESDRVLRAERLVRLLEEHDGICVICGERPVCEGLARNADSPNCSHCEGIIREKQIHREAILEKAIHNIGGIGENPILVT